MNLYDFASLGQGYHVAPEHRADSQTKRAWIPDSAAIPELTPNDGTEPGRFPQTQGHGGSGRSVPPGGLDIPSVQLLPLASDAADLPSAEPSSGIVDHQEEDGSWGGIQPPWVYSLIALNVLG